jgi:acetyltransferase-like isoleucine patch superfamily enzyme
MNIRGFISELPLPLPQSLARIRARRNGVILKSNNVVIAPFAILRGNVVVGDNCIFERGSSVWADDQFCRLIIEDDVTIGSSSELIGQWEGKERISTCRICKDTYIGRNNTIDLTGNLYIGKGCVFTDDIHVYTHRHEIPSRRELFKSTRRDPIIRSVFIDDDVFIGVRAIILSDVKIGKGAFVGAGAVVTKDVEPYSFVAGVPARKIGERPL